MTTHRTPPTSRRHHVTHTDAQGQARRRARATGKRADRHPARITHIRPSVRHAAQPLVHVAGHVSLLIFLETVAKIILDKTPLLALLSLH